MSWSAEWLLSVGLLLPLTAPAQTRITSTRPAMGTPWQISCYTTDTLLAHRAIDSAFARIEAVEQSMSDYRPDSEIRTVSRLPSRQFHLVSADLYRVLTFSRELHRYSQGAFDVTIGQLTKRWRRAIRQQVFPTEVTQGARPQVQGITYRLHPTRGLWLAHDSLHFDLGGVAKGYALDVAGEVLGSFGIHCFLIDGGGDLLLGDAPPDRDGWTIALPDGHLDTANVAIASSGPSYRYLLHDGLRYSHLLDPRTGVGVTHSETVTVFAPTGMLADGLASALSVRIASRVQLMKHYPRMNYIVTPSYQPSPEGAP
ncbi:FAD:protein FMN transferase [Neolewinella sp.]|uniref:FAD:protein FMN transferase n=1 Tax=Neolewinella sp. TaxID=2993543 RepID=UPI003B523EA9